ncbi:MAG: hypothetical protein GX319_09335 [Clostridiales bacterium]|nr:lysoplasmalogenase family protein [Bacillota bacterium]NLK04590.1 hypothetical protein [Clostridiales bacterium]
MEGPYFKHFFILLQMVLYSIFLTLDFLGRNYILSNQLKFTVVVLCFIYVIIKGQGYGRETTCLRYAMVLTLVSDILILLLGYYLYGVMTFILVQQLHGMRISALFNREGLAKKRKISLKTAFLVLFYQGLVSITVLIMLWRLGLDINPLLIASIIYFVCICTNVLRSIKLSKVYWGSRDVRCFTIGMVLFLLCDINVGLFNLSDFITPSPAYNIIYSISSILMWTFYAPSQVLIALSVENEKKVQKNKKILCKKL